MMHGGANRGSSNSARRNVNMPVALDEASSQTYIQCTTAFFPARSPWQALAAQAKLGCLTGTNDMTRSR